MVIFGLIGVDRVVWAKEEGFGTTCGHSEPLVGADVVPWLAFPSPTMVTRVGTDPQPEQKLARLVRVCQLKEINGSDPDTHEVPMHSFACFFFCCLVINRLWHKVWLYTEIQSPGEICTKRKRM